MFLKSQRLRCELENLLPPCVGVPLLISLGCCMRHVSRQVLEVNLDRSRPKILSDSGTLHHSLTPCHATPEPTIGSLSDYVGKPALGTGIGEPRLGLHSKSGCPRILNIGVWVLHTRGNRKLNFVVLLESACVCEGIRGSYWLLETFWAAEGTVVHFAWSRMRESMSCEHN